LSICFNRFIFLGLARIFCFFFGLIFLYFDLAYFLEWEIVSLQRSSIVITFFFDWIRFLFISFVLFISGLVIIYRKDYIYNDININRFIILILIFVFSIILLIIRPNLIRILLGWDGLGLISYCLVIYFQNVKSYNAGILTALSNRVGDVALLIAIAWMLNYGRWNYLFYIDFMKIDFFIKIIGVFIILAAITKSAQIPFSSWLPAAIAAPTPVSALVHSSTLVTAGVYLLIRFNLLFLDNVLGQTLLLIGGLTIFMSGAGANFEFDLKKIIALSTLRQLGLIIIILSIGYYKLAFFHLLTHAIFKALLFLCSGSIIHNIINSQDIRSIGGLCMNMPLTSSFFNIANLALCGIPFLAGFYSKDLILEISRFSYINLYVYFIFYFSTGLTVIYSFRLVYYSIVGEFNRIRLHPLNDERWLILRRILLLVFISMIRGSLLRWVIIPTPYFIFLPIRLKILTLFICLIGGLIGYFLSLLSSLNFLNNNNILSQLFIVNFFSLIWFIPFIFTFILKYPLKFRNSLKIIDQGWREFFGSKSLFNYLKSFRHINQIIHYNSLKLYLLRFVLWFILLLLILFF